MKYIRYIRKDENGKSLSSILPNIFQDDSKTYFMNQIRNYNNNNKLQVFNIGYEHSKPGAGLVDWRTHRHRLHYVIDGCGTFNGQPVKKGQGFFTWENEKHSFLADENNPWTCLWVTFCGKNATCLLNEFTDLSLDYPVFDIPSQDKIIALFKDAIYVDHSDTNLDQYLIGWLYTLLSYHGYSYMQSLPIQTNTISKYCENQFRQAITIIGNRFDTQLSVSDIANEIYISPQYLDLVFKKAMGISPKEYIIKCRMENAEQLLLHSDFTIGEIAASCGYTDYLHFTKSFKKRYGMSPTVFRTKK